MPNNAYGFTYPLADDQADGPAAFLALANSAGPYSNMRFATAAARDALLTSPVQGMKAWLNDLKIWTAHDGTTWLPFGGTTQTYTPVWTASTTNPVLSNGVIAGRYTQVGKMVTCSIELTMGSSTTYGSGTWSLTLPVGARTSNRIGLTGLAIDQSSGTRYFSYGYWVGPSSTATITYFAVSGANVISSSVDLNSPFAWASTDTFMISGTYEAA